MTNKISVIVPCYNGGKYLLETLKCLHSQTRPADEILVVDDGSTEPETLNVFARLPAGIRVLHKPNEGLGYARNSGIDNTTGDLVVMVDDDDLIRADCLAKMERALEDHPECGFAVSQMELFGGENGIVAVPRFNAFLELDNNYHAAMAMFRRSVFDQGIRYPRIAGYEDWCLWLDCIEHGIRGHVLDEPLFRYRRKVNEGLLHDANRLRHELMPQIRALHPKLYTPKGRAQLKLKHAPGIELLCASNPEVPRLRRFLKDQSLQDCCLTAFPALTSREALALMRGKLVAMIHEPQLPLLDRALPSFLEQVARLAEVRGAGAIVVPTDVHTLAKMAETERVIPYPQGRKQNPGDLIFVRTFRIADLTTRDVPIDEPASALFARATDGLNALLFAQDFFRQVDEVEIKKSARSWWNPTEPPKSVTPPAVQSWKRARATMVALLGEDRTAATVDLVKQPLLRLVRLSRKVKALTQAREVPPAQPLLLPQQRREHFLLNDVPFRFERFGPWGHDDGERRVLLALPWVVCGGVERAALDMARIVTNAGYRLTVVTEHHSRNEWAHNFLPYLEDMIDLSLLVPACDRVGYIAELVASRNIGAVFTVNSWLGLESVRAIKRRRPAVRTVDYMHTDFQRPNTDFTRKACTVYDGYLDRHWTSTRYLMERCRQYGADASKLRLIRTACDEENIYNPDKVPPEYLHTLIGIPPDRPVIGMIARLHPDKNPLFMCRVFHRLRSRWSDPSRPLHCVFIGDGPLKEALRKELDRAGMGSWTHFLPSDIPMPLAMRSLSLVMLASDIEGLPLVFIEAMAMGVPVVSTNLEGIPELVDNEVGACVPNAQDDEERLQLLCDAALPILEDEKFRNVLGRRARERIKASFSFKQTQTDYLAAFDDLFSTARSPSLELVAGAS